MKDLNQDLAKMLPLTLMIVFVFQSCKTDEI